MLHVLFLENLLKLDLQKLFFEILVTVMFDYFLNNMTHEFINFSAPTTDANQYASYLSDVL